MHNLKKNTKSIEDAYTDAKKGLHKDKASFMETNEKRYKDYCQDYDKKASEGKLNELVPLWVKDDNPKSEYNLSKELYSASRPIVTNHWKTLQNNNPDSKFDDVELLCPICSLKPVEETDHFAPRSTFPEYSCHLTNLIPLCHSCNHDKSENWLDRNGKQIFFNAFYDNIDFYKIFEININYDSGNQTMIPNVTLSTTLDPINNPVHFRVKSTCEELHLLKEYNSRISSILRTLTLQIKSTYKVTKGKYTSAEDFINDQIEIWKDQLATNGFNLPIERLLYSHLVANSKLHSDLTQLLA